MACGCSKVRYAVVDEFVPDGVEPPGQFKSRRAARLWLQEHGVTGWPNGSIVAVRP